MRRASITRLAGVFLVMTLGQPSESAEQTEAGSAPSRERRYPEAPRSDTVDDYHGTRVADPYRPLEDPDAPDDPRLDRGREPDHGRLSRSDPGPRSDQKASDRALGLREVRRALPGGRALFLHAEQRASEPERPLHGPLTRCRAEGPARPQHALRGWHRRPGGGFGEPRRDALRLRPGRGGLRLAGVAGPRRRHRARDRDDLLRWIKFSEASWTRDGRGFYYSRFPEPKPGEDLKGANYYHKLYFHKLGTPQAGRRPRLRASRPEGVAVPRQRHRRRPVPDRHRLEGDGRQVPHPLQAPGRRRRGLRRADRQLRPRIHVPRQRRPGLLVQDRPRCPARPGHRHRHPPARACTLERDHSPGGGDARRRIGGRRSVHRLVPEGRTHPGQGLRTRRRLGPPGRLAWARARPPGSAASGRTARRSTRSPRSRRRRRSIATKLPRERAPSSASPSSPSTPTTTRRPRSSTVPRTGRRSRCSSATRRGSQPGGKTPTLLYGYGGFNISLTPAFSVSNLVWMEMGGSSPSPTCGAAASMARHGTRRAPSSPSRTSSTTSSPRPSG